MSGKKRQTKADLERAAAIKTNEAIDKRLATLPKPGEQTQAAIDEAATGNKARRRRVQIQGEMTDGRLELWPTHSDLDGWSGQLQNAFGTTSKDFECQTLQQLTNVTRSYREAQTVSDMNTGLAVVDGLEPQNEIEAMLAVQMAATHNVAMHMLGKAKHSEHLQHLEVYGNLATKLLRTFSTQIEALAKLRRKGEQTVRVEHVHVHSGGQAIVGNVNQPGGGGGVIENRSQPHATDDPRALVFAPGAPVLCYDANRQALPVATGAGESTMQDAPGSQEKRRTSRAG